MNVTGLPVNPVAAAVNVFVPALAPSVHVVSVAIPLAFVTIVAGLAGLIVPTPAVTVKTTLTPLTPLPTASVTFTLGGAVTAVLIVADCVVTEFETIAAAAPTVPVALNVTGLPVRPLTVARTEFAPAALPSVQDVSVAMPLALVDTVAGNTVPPPVNTENTTLTPLTGLPPASVTFTLGDAATAVPAVAVCVVTEFDAIVVAVPTVPVAVNVTGLPVSPVAAAAIVLVPALAPTVHVVSVATPLAFVTIVAGVAGVIAPPPAVSVKITLAPLTPLPFASVTFTLGGAATALLTVADCAVSEFAISVVATPAVPFALNVTGLPVSPVTVAVTVLTPAVVPSVQLVSVAMPLAFVATVAGLTGLSTPPPAVIANTTLTPLTGLPPASVTRTLGGALAALPAVALCVVKEFAETAVGVPTVPVALNVIGLPASPDAAALTLFAPAAAPSDHVVSVAIPLAFVTTVAGDAGLSVPLPDTSVNTTLAPLTPLPTASVTFTLGGAVTAALTVADCVVTEFATRLVATPTVPVALNVTGLPANPPTVARTEFAPATLPSVHDVTVAIPLAFVATVSGVMLPPPLNTENATLTPVTGLPPASVTFTLGGVATDVPAVANCVVTEFAAIVVGDPTVPVAVNVTGLPVKPVAVAVNVFAPAVTPSVQLVTVAMPLALVVTVAGLAGDSVPAPLVIVNTTVAPFTGLPPASVTFTLGATLTAVPIVVDCVVTEFDAMVVGAPIAPVAANVTGLPVRLVTVAVTELAPAVVPSVQLVSVAIPLAFVTTVAGLAGLVVPPPPVTVNTTLTPATAVPLASVTFTLGGAATTVPAVVDCVVTEFAAIVVGAPATAVIVAPPVMPSLVARMIALPSDTAVTTPVVETVATAVFELAHVTARPVNTPPFASRAVADACVVRPTITVGEARLTVTVAIGTGFTVILLDPVTPSTVASIRTPPDATPRTRPALDTMATAGLLELHCTTRPVIG